MQQNLYQGPQWKTNEKTPNFCGGLHHHLEIPPARLLGAPLPNYWAQCVLDWQWPVQSPDLIWKL